jgi:hypothetical protein
MSTYYVTLKIEHDASLECIKKTYRKMQLENHPNKIRHLPEAQRANCESTSKAANVAYKVLSDAARRSMYDEGLIPNSHPVPQSQPQKPPTPPNSTPGSNHVPKLDIDPTNPPYNPHCTPVKFPNNLYFKGLFSLNIRLEGRYEPYDWGLKMAFEEKDKVIILMSVREMASFDRKQPDVAIAVSSTPLGRRVSKIESVMSSIGPRITLCVTICTSVNSVGHLYKEFMGNPLNNSKA